MKYRHLQIAFVTAALAALPAVAAAQTPKVPPSHQTGFYIGAGGGLTTVSLDNSTFVPPAGTAWDNEDTAGAAKGFVGYRFHKHFGVEGGYYYLGKLTQTYAGAGGYGTVENTLDAWMLDAVGYLPLNEGFSFIGRVGAVNGSLDTKLTGTTPSNLLPVSQNNTNFTWGLGAQLDINHRWGIRAEYENLGKFGGTSTGEMRVNLWSASALIKF
ncbi:MAG: porin family protein [Betaproteobacteria bacterium]|jgi:OOP family OmpA-OmpF porin|nr:porin family protein [Betaproteobacteria bacterium]